MDSRIKNVMKIFSKWKFCALGCNTFILFDSFFFDGPRVARGGVSCGGGDEGAFEACGRNGYFFMCEIFFEVKF